MATFDININAVPTIDYTVTPVLPYKALDCDAPITVNNPIGLIKNTNTLSIDYLLLTYINASSWKSLKIKNIIYSSGTDVYLEANGVKVPSVGATVFTFDITGQLVDDAIANLYFKLNNYTPVQTHTVTFDLAIESLDSQIGTYYPVQLYVKHGECSTEDPVEDIIITPVEDNLCALEIDVLVNVPPEESRYITIDTSDAYGFPASLTETITTSKIYTLRILAETSANSLNNIVSSKVLLKVFDDSSSNIPITAKGIIRAHINDTCASL